MPIPFWRDAESAWDVLYLNGVRVPGIPNITVDKSRSVQINKSKKENGTTLADNGYEGAKIKGSLRLYKPEELQALMDLLPSWDPRNSAGVSNALIISHPATAMAGVSKIYAPQWTFPTPTSDDLTITFSALEWFPAPKPVSGGGSGSGKGIVGGLLDAVNDGVAILADPFGNPNSPFYGANQP